MRVHSKRSVWPFCMGVLGAHTPLASDIQPIMCTLCWMCTISRKSLAAVIAATLFTQKCTYPVESSVSALQLLTLDSRCCIPCCPCMLLHGFWTHIQTGTPVKECVSEGKFVDITETMPMMGLFAYVKIIWTVNSGANKEHEGDNL